ncbi:MAG TPA: biopolymer transporter ExbD [Gemmataceae bacterium]|nr:biopolymer transporter ExbD [Gemmataceae bacterium]
MAEQRQFIDVWITETNSVYREVPYTVVADWVQQGRLLEDDMLRNSGTAEWQPLHSVPAFAAYLPREEQYRTEDKAEALEPVQVDFIWKARQADEDEDVDMIPLIDVSLVLLIFFMMTATVAGAASLINTPFASHGAQLINDPRSYWIGITQTADRTPLYSLAQADQSPSKENVNLTEKEVMAQLDEKLKEGPAVVTIKADKELPYDIIRKMTVNLELRRGKVRMTYAGVSEKRENQ